MTFRVLCNCYGGAFVRPDVGIPTLSRNTHVFDVDRRTSDDCHEQTNT